MMTQELFNQLLANSPLCGVLIWSARKLTDINERLSRMEGVIDVYFGIERKGKK